MLWFQMEAGLNLSDRADPHVTDNPDLKTKKHRIETQHMNTKPHTQGRIISGSFLGAMIGVIAFGYAQPYLGPLFACVIALAAGCAAAIAGWHQKEITARVIRVAMEPFKSKLRGMAYLKLLAHLCYLGVSMIWFLPLSKEPFTAVFALEKSPPIATELASMFHCGFLLAALLFPVFLTASGIQKQPRKYLRTCLKSNAIAFFLKEFAYQFCMQATVALAIVGLVAMIGITASAMATLFIILAPAFGIARCIIWVGRHNGRAACLIATSSTILAIATCMRLHAFGDASVWLISIEAGGIAAMTGLILNKTLNWLTADDGMIRRMATLSPIKQTEKYLTPYLEWVDNMIYGRRKAA